MTRCSKYRTGSRRPGCLSDVLQPGESMARRSGEAHRHPFWQAPEVAPVGAEAVSIETIQQPQMVKPAAWSVASFKRVACRGAGVRLADGAERGRSGGCPSPGTGAAVIHPGDRLQASSGGGVNQAPPRRRDRRLLPPQRARWVDGGGANRRDANRRQRHEDQQGGDDGEYQRIARLDAEDDAR